jgi:hypothetical protein
MSEWRKINKQGMYYPDDILAQIISINWLFEKVFWKLLKPLVYNETVSNSVHILENVYWFRDARKTFPDKLIRKEFNNISEKVFRFAGWQQDQSNFISQWVNR